MNKFSLTYCLLLVFTQGLLISQDVGIGTKDPSNKLHVLGNLLINAPYISTNTPPTAAQTKTMVNNGFINFPFTDSTGRFFDPGGPNGDYISNLIADAWIDYGAGIGIEFTIESIGLGTGDSLILVDPPSALAVLRVGNGYTTPGKWIFQGSSLFITFKSNGDLNNGIGFSIKFRRLYSPPGEQPALTGFAGNAFFFDTKNGALRSGYINNYPRGEWSIGIGLYPRATGFCSVATGEQTIASGYASTAFGRATTASGSYSTAMGEQTIASGFNSTVMGVSNTVAGNTSIAMGYACEVYGNQSTAIGTRMLIPNYTHGAFALGDYESSADPIQTTLIGAGNTFTSRFRNGYYLLTSQNAPGGNYANRTGVTCAGGQNSWSAWSDVNRKENFLPVDGEYFLRQISAMPQYTWNYKAQSPKEFRHYGPMAQDLFNAFGKDELGVIGNDTMINQQDLLGIEFIAIQALEKRTSELQNKLDQVLKTLESYQKQIAILEEKNRMLTAARVDHQN